MTSLRAWARVGAATTALHSTPRDATRWDPDRVRSVLRVNENW